MDGEIIPRSLILDRARRAVASGQPSHQFQAWPIGTAAGREFERQLQHQQALRDAARRVGEGTHA